MKQAGRIYSQNLLELGLDDAEIPADPLLPDSALAGRRAALRPLDGIRGEPCGAPLGYASTCDWLAGQGAQLLGRLHTRLQAAAI